jgi:exodeoxyribonuclease V alpha subunit
MSDETCWFLASDFDKQYWQRDALAFLATCREKNVPVALERSRSGNGAHVWIFFSEPVPASEARRLPDDGELNANFDGRIITYGFGELDTLVPAYAATIHKSQGSEYPAVVIPVMTQHYTMLQRNLLYTGVTRGKKLVVLVGQKKAVAIAVRNISGRRRWSKLSEWLASV